DAQRVALGVAEVLAHGAGRVWRNVLHRSWVGSRSRDDDGVVHRTVVIQGLHHLRDRRALLADGAVDTDQVAALAVDNGVERDRGLAGLAVANDELALATADGDHRVDGFQPSGHGLFHGLAVDN